MRVLSISWSNDENMGIEGIRHYGWPRLLSLMTCRAGHFVVLINPWLLLVPSVLWALTVLT